MREVMNFIICFCVLTFYQLLLGKRCSLYILCLIQMDLNFSSWWTLSKFIRITSSVFNWYIYICIIIYSYILPYCHHLLYIWDCYCVMYVLSNVMANNASWNKRNEMSRVACRLWSPPATSCAPFVRVVVPWIICPWQESLLPLSLSLCVVWKDEERIRFVKS